MKINRSIWIGESSKIYRIHNNAQDIIFDDVFELGRAADGILPEEIAICKAGMKLTECSLLLKGVSEGCGA